MKAIISVLFFIYQWLILFPLAIIVTILTCLFTILFAYTSKSSYVKSFPAVCWSKFMCYASFMRVTVEGQELVDKESSYVFAANHQSAFDIWLINGFLGQPFSWVIKKELGKIPLLGSACRAIGHIFVDRSNPVEARKSIANAEKNLGKGYSIVIFPEGTRSKTGKVGSFKRGAFTLASDLKIPIVPVTIVGSHGRISRSFPRVVPGRIKMIIHKPIPIAGGLTEQEMRQLSVEVRDIVISALDK